MLVQRDLAGRYRGSLLGMLWIVSAPLFMLFIYAFVFGEFFPGRWISHAHGSMMHFAGFLFCGLILHTLMTEAMTKAPSMIVNNVNFVKKVVFPLESLAWVSIGISSIGFLASLFILLLFFSVYIQGLSWSIITLPVIILPLVFMTMGFSWVLSALGVYIRDLREVMTMLSRALLFVSPVFYSVQQVPESWQAIYYMNPLVFPIEQLRVVLLEGQLPDWEGLIYYTIISVIVAWAGFSLFQKLRAEFADVV